MILSENTLGTINITEDFFAALVGSAAGSCFGVKAMVSNSPVQGIKSLLFPKDIPDKGVKVTSQHGKLVIDLHIAITFGVNISEIVKSIIHKVRYVVEDSTKLEVAKVNVFVEKMSS